MPTGAIYDIITMLCRCDGIGRRSGLKIHRWRQRTGSSPVTGTIKRLGSLEYGALTILSGCSAVGSAPALGAGCRRFESCHSDHLSWKNRLFRRFFCVLSSIFAVLAIAVLRWFQGQKSSGSTSKDSRRNRQIPNPSLTAKESDDLPGGIGLTVIRPSQDIRRLPGRQRMLSSD